MDKQEPKIIGPGSSNEELIEETVSEILQKHAHQVAAFLKAARLPKLISYLRIESFNSVNKQLGCRGNGRILTFISLSMTI